jgi:hypothetical protein
MKIKIVDKCCNEFSELEIKPIDLVFLYNTESFLQIAPAKKDHSIVIHPDMTIEYRSI